MYFILSSTLYLYIFYYIGNYNVAKFVDNSDYIFELTMNHGQLTI